MKNGKFVITSYFTYETPYSDICHKYLMPSVTELKLHTYIRGVDNKGSWQKNTSYKPEFLKIMLEHHDEDVVFVDSDAEILSYPSIFNEIPEQYIIAVHILDKSSWYGRNYTSDRYELLSGTLWIKNCDESRRLLDAWESACNATNMWEQKVLQKVLEQLGIVPYQLPLSYCYIKTMPNNKPPRVKVDCPVIVHNQVSRSLKNRV